MITRLECVFFTLFLFANFGLKAEIQQPELLNRLYDKAGLEVYLQTLQVSLRQSCQAYEGHISSDILNEVCSPEATRIGSEPYRQAVVAVLSRHLTEKHIEEILKWLDSPLGRRIHHMENMVEPTAAADYISSKLRVIPPRNVRVQLVNKLMLHLGAVETSIDIASASTLKVAEWVNQKLPDNEQIDLAVIEQTLLQQKVEMEAATGESLQQQFLYTYRALPDVELNRYVQFSETESMQQFYIAMQKVINRLL